MQGAISIFWHWHIDFTYYFEIVNFLKMLVVTTSTVCYTLCVSQVLFTIFRVRCMNVL